MPDIAPGTARLVQYPIPLKVDRGYASASANNHPFAPENKCMGMPHAYPNSASPFPQLARK